MERRLTKLSLTAILISIAIRYSLALRLRRTCSDHNSYILCTNELVGYLTNRGYDKTFLKSQIQQASNVPGTDALKDKPIIRTTTTPFVIIYNPALPNIARIIHQHSHVLYSSDRCRNVFENLPLVAYRHCNNISDILVRAQLPETRDLNNSRTTLVLFSATAGTVPPAPTLITLVINILSIPQERPINSNLIYFQCYLHDSISAM